MVRVLPRVCTILIEVLALEILIVVVTLLTKLLTGRGAYIRIATVSIYFAIATAAATATATAIAAAAAATHSTATTCII